MVMAPTLGAVIVPFLISPAVIDTPVVFGESAPSMGPRKTT
jgi:hypothetical protein